MKTDVFEGRGWQEKKQILRLLGILQKPWEKQGFGHEPGWQEKKQTRGRRRRTMESPREPLGNLGKRKVLPHRPAGGNGASPGAICATWQILRLLENLQKPW